jgi:hypothetical protein
MFSHDLASLPEGCMTFRSSASLTLLGVALSASACASGSGTGGVRTVALSNSFSYGYMIPGAGLASAIGVPATDTIPEFPARNTVPTTLANAITQEVATGRWNNQCTRRFGGPSIYAVIFHRACDSSLGPDADPQVVVGFSSDGRVIGRVRWSGPSTVTLLYPARRF